MKKRTQLTLALLACALIGVSFALAANFGYKLSRPDHPDRREDLRRLIAVMTPTEGSEASGIVQFMQLQDERILVTGEIRGLSPNGTHALHIHEFGDLRGSDAQSAGSHYNPEGKNHGLPEAPEHHAGDLGNITADANGIASIRMERSDLTLNGQKNPIIGRSLIVHAGTDDGSQPVGNAGARLAGGVIGVMNPQFSAESQ